MFLEIQLLCCICNCYKTIKYVGKKYTVVKYILNKTGSVVWSGSMDVDEERTRAANFLK